MGQGAKNLFIYFSFLNFFIPLFSFSEHVFCRKNLDSAPAGRHVQGTEGFGPEESGSCEFMRASVRDACSNNASNFASIYFVLDVNVQDAKSGKIISLMILTLIFFNFKMLILHIISLDDIIRPMLSYF